MKINKSFIRIALAVGLVGLAACSGSSSSSSRNRNSTLADGSICYTDVERAGLIEIAQPRAYQAAVLHQDAIPAQPEVIGQPEVKAQAGVPAQVAQFDIPAVADQPEVPFQAAVPDQPEVPAHGAYWLHYGYVWSDATVRGMTNGGGWTWIDDHHVQSNAGVMSLVDAEPRRPAVKGTPEVPHQDAVPGHRGYKKGETITEAIPAIVGQPEVKAQPAVAEQAEILASPEVKAATKDEVIAEINAVQSCTPTTVAAAVVPTPGIALTYESGNGSEKTAKVSWTPDAADKEAYSLVVKQNGMNGPVMNIGSSAGSFPSAPLNPGCTDTGEFIFTRRSDNQLIAVVTFNYPGQDFTKCEPVIPSTTVVNETTTEAPVAEVTTTDAPKAIAEVTTTIKAAAVATTTEAPKATDAPATTLAPVADATAKAAIVDSTATEVKLPAADINLEINLADVYTGFGVTASDVKSVEYQIADGSWVALTKGKSIKIPKTASKLSVRVTKTSGEKVVSEKAIVHTEAATETTVATSDTTMAPADTTAPVTTEAPASSGSSSSNNTVLYILGFAIVAGAVVMFLKKKSATTK